MRPKMALRSGVAGLILLSGVARGQHSNPPPMNPPSPSPPAQPAPAQQPAAQTGQTPAMQPAPAQDPNFKVEWPKVTEGPYVEKTQPKEWSLQVILDLASGGTIDPAVPSQNSLPFIFDSVTIVWPIVGLTGNSIPETNSTMSWLRFEGHDMISGPFAKETTPDDPHPVLIRRMATGELYPSDVMLGKWTYEKPGTRTRAIQLQVNIRSTSYRTVFDDANASKVGWPSGPWPEEAAACFQPQMFIDCGIDPVTFEMKMYDMRPIRQAVAAWTRSNPRALTPVKLAKYLMFKVVHEALIPGKADTSWGTPRAAFLGLNLLGAPLALQTRQVGVTDMGTVLVAVMREAGLPARLVWGYQGYNASEDGNRVIDWMPYQRLRCWVELCLYDEGKKTFNWVPMDYDRFRYTATAMMDLNMPWPYFGSISYAHDMIPVALQAFPPTTVMGYGYPAFWGWVMQPGVPTNLSQAVTISASRAQTSPATTKPNDSKLPPNK